MSCQTCGHPAEEKIQPHHLGCPQKLRASDHENLSELIMNDACEHDECSEPKKPWTGRGARPKYCAVGHK